MRIEERRGSGDHFVRMEVAARIKKKGERRHERGECKLKKEKREGGPHRELKKVRCKEELTEWNIDEREKEEDVRLEPTIEEVFGGASLATYFFYLQASSSSSMNSLQKKRVLEMKFSDGIFIANFVANLLATENIPSLKRALLIQFMTDFKIPSQI